MKTIKDILELSNEIVLQNDNFLQKYRIYYDPMYNWIEAESFYLLENGDRESIEHFFKSYTLKTEADIQIVYWTLFKLKREL